MATRRSGLLITLGLAALAALAALLLFLALPHKSPPPEVAFRFQYHIFRNSAADLDDIVQALKPFSIPGDSFVIRGDTTMAVPDWNVVRAQINRLKQNFPQNKIYFQGSGWTRMREVITVMPNDVLQSVEGIMVKYEPQNEEQYGPYPPQGPHFFPYVLQQYTELSQLATSRGTQLWAIPSGRYIKGFGNEGDRGWDYGQIGAVVHRVVIQTQGACRIQHDPGNPRHNVNFYGGAFDELNQQFTNAGVTQASRHWIDMLAVGAEGDAFNNLTPEQSFECVKIAEAHGAHEHAPQWGNNNTSAMVRLLQLRQAALNSSPIRPVAQRQNALAWMRR